MTTHRGSVPGLPCAFPLGELLPGVYFDDDFVQRWTAGMDDVLAPVYATLDGLDGYLDAHTAPVDFVAWLAGWVDAELDERWPLPVQRAVVGAALDTHRRRGTVAALRAHVRRVCGCDVQIEESGGARWSREPDMVAPGAATPRLVVRVPASHWNDVSRRRIRRAVDEMRPAQIPVELVPESVS